MLSNLKSFFDQILGEEEKHSPSHSAHTLHLATAALMIELCRSDRTVDESELTKITAILQSHFNLDSRQLDQLLQLANAEADNATSLYEFTSLFNEHLGFEEKLTLITHLWEIAYADGNVDRYEDHLIRQVAELLYVPHSDFIRCKLQVRDRSA